MDAPDRPSATLLARQAERLAGLRAAALRRAGIAHRRNVLDLGSGPGVVTPELVRRSGGRVVALDPSRAALADVRGVPRVAARAEELPFRDGAFDLVFAELVFLWARDLAAASREVARVLAPGGVLVALEPDYGGLVEEPASLALGDVWREGITRAGGDPLVGRHLLVALARAGLSVETSLSSSLAAPDDDRFALVLGLPLTPDERARVEAARRADVATPAAEKVVHLPIFCAIAGARLSG